jgi:uncharacterized protein YdeI (YjbR/CyaY-like superfamily)
MTTKAAKTELPIITFESPEAWENWLAENHARPNGVWLRLFKKYTGKPTISYEEALDVALCFGWIDGQGRGYDEQSHLQKFTPRRPRSVWSKLNTQRVERLIREGRMRPAGLAQVEEAKRDGRWERAYAPPSAAEIPEDFLAELNKRPNARAFFDTLNKRNTYPIAYRLHNAKKPETRKRRMGEILAMLERGEKFYA